ncbi:MAG: protein translocase subunit SecD [Tildeniella nuda ZEHNDER 1965/U140]|jgi:preprotein translocase subunit SecD|nr:protein translocase subunit SecD [Tildeniella nuda ZEHNDER 1965/U140]
MGRQRSLLGLILVLLIAAVVIIVKIPTRLGLDLQGGSQLTLQVKTTQEVKEITERELEAVLKVIEGRVNGLGVSEPVVQTVGKDQILVQLPGVNDPQQAERVLGGTAQLDFRKQKSGTETQLQIEKQNLREKLETQAQLKKTPDQAAIAKNQAELKATNGAIADLFDKTELTGKNLKDAYPEPVGASQNWHVGLKFDPRGGELFAELTKSIAGTGRTLGIFLDNAPISADFAYTVDVQYAQTGITGGGAVIEGNFTAERASDIAVQLRGGALPVPVEVVENRTVGATLGRDSIERSIYASVGSLILVLLFLGIYYLLPGTIADLALVIYALLSWASFALLGVTMTLPGVAGFILSIGMAVDANVLIFERTREELRAGKSLYRSVEAGFYRAFSSILDGNVTVAIACVSLFWLGSGLVKGFALTLAIGVAISFFTAVTCTRTFLMVSISSPELRQPKFFIRNPSATAAEIESRTRKISVNRTRKRWWTVSTIAILGGLIAMGISWQQLGSPLRPSLEFIGGTRLQFELDCTQPQNCRPISLDAVRDVLSEQGIDKNSSVQILGNDQRAFSIRTKDLGVDQRTALTNALSTEVGTFDIKKTQIDTVGPTIGRQLLSSGLMALLVSFVGIVIYISLRYQIDFAIFAIVALLHNILITLGIFALLGLSPLQVEVDSLFVVALLTITGFSVNDTVVIYDRIRELMEINPDRSFSETVDDAVNQTLQRSLNIAFIVLLTLFALLLFGGDTLKYFALAQIIGFTTGIYTSIFIATTLLTWWRERTEKSAPIVPALVDGDTGDRASSDISGSSDEA